MKPGTVPDDFTVLNEGDLDPTFNKRIDSLVLSMRSHVVYLDEDYEIWWAINDHYGKEPRWWGEIFNKVKYLEKISRDTLPPRYLKEFRELLAEAVARALEEKDLRLSRQALNYANTYLNASLGIMAKSRRVFLCHSSKDHDFVRKVALDLEARGIPVWLDEWALKVGDSLVSKISKGIKESGWLAVVLSRNSMKSRWVMKELDSALILALQKNKVFVLPLLIEDCEIPLLLKDTKYADFRVEYRNGLAALLRTIIPEEKKSPRGVT